MGSDHTPADDIVYDLVSIQYHALQAGYTYGKYLEDAEGHEDVQEFIRHIGTDNLHVISVCQPTVPVLAAISLMATDKDPKLPKTMTMMGGPIDPRRSPTARSPWSAPGATLHRSSAACRPASSCLLPKKTA